MPRTRPPYAPEFRRQIVEMVRAGRTPEELSREFEPTAQTIHNWVKQMDLDEGRRADGLTSAEREEVRRLRREVKQLKVEREIFKKPQPGSRGRPTRCHRSIRVREHASGDVSGADDVPSAGCLLQRLLRMASPSAVGQSTGQRTAARSDPRDPCDLLRNVRLAADPRGAPGRGRECGSEPCLTADAAWGSGGCDETTEVADDEARQGCPAGAGSGAV